MREKRVATSAYLIEMVFNSWRGGSGGSGRHRDTARSTTSAPSKTRLVFDLNLTYGVI